MRRTFGVGALFDEGGAAWWEEVEEGETDTDGEGGIGAGEGDGYGKGVEGVGQQILDREEAEE
jgi:hypothetical protein